MQKNSGRARRHSCAVRFIIKKHSVSITAVEARALKGLRGIAIFEAAKGALVLAIGFGLLALIHRDFQELGESVVAHLHLNPAHHYPQIFIHSLAKLNSSNLIWIALGALLYTVLRWIEAYGLWHARKWAEWLAIISGGIYLPLEIYDIYEKVTAVRLTVTALNICLLIYLIWIRKTRQGQKISADLERAEKS